jgi:xanthine dehydrogenase accessory factor
MRDILSTLEQWIAANEAIALATVIQTWGSSPRKAGAKMGITASGKICGSVSGGCVEGAVADAAQKVLKTRAPQLIHFGVADETAWEVGLACGGSLDVFVQPLDVKVFAEIRQRLNDEKNFAVVTTIKGDEIGKVEIKENREKGLEVGDWGFVEVVSPPPQVVMVGGVHIAIALASIAKTLNYRTIVIDPRRAFGNQERFPNVDTLMQAWCDEAFAKIKINDSTAIAFLTHDPKIDDQGLKIALASEAFYVGALGSRKTHEERKKRLVSGGVTESQLNRLHAPIGLNIGAQSPEEIALSIMAEIVAARSS